MDIYWNPMVPELMVTNFTRSLGFYTEQLDFEIRFQRSNPDFAYLEKEQIQMMLVQAHDDSWRVGEMTYPFGRGVNFQIELTDIEPIYNRLKNSNITLYRDVEETWYDTGNTLSGQKEFLVQDPDGYLLRFASYLGEKKKNQS